jgi:catechol 2,3-dioxygenase-like lactoylglutathione lyase family enzyme
VTDEAAAPALVGVHHVQLTVPRGQEDAARRFYCDVLGMREMPKPAALAGRGGLWLSPGGTERGPLVHVGTEDGVDRAATKAHVAYVVRDLATWRRRLERHGIRPLNSIPIPGFDRFEFRDPFGNRAELIEPTPGAGPAPARNGP